MHSAPAVRTSSGAGRRRLAAVLLGALFLLHQDAWLWREARLVLGLPAGLAYHVAYCLAAAATLWLAVRWAWPPGVPADGDRGEERR